MKNLRLRLIVDYLGNRMTIKDSYYDLIQLSKCFEDGEEAKRLKKERKIYLKQYTKIYKQEYKKILKERR